MNHVISEDINNLIEYLFYNYNSNYNLSFLKSRYTPNISIEKKNEKRKKKEFKFKKKITFLILNIVVWQDVGVVKNQLNIIL